MPDVEMEQVGYCFHTAWNESPLGAAVCEAGDVGV